MTPPTPEDDSGSGPIWRAMRRYRFVILLASLILLVASIPIVHMLGGESRPRMVSILFTATFMTMVLSAVFAISRSRRMRIVMSLVLIPELVLHALQITLNETGLVVARELLDISIVTYAIIVIFLGLFAGRRVTVDTIASSLCVYLLLAVWWASAFTLLELLDPGSFTFGKEMGEARHLTAVSVDAMYFSFVTISTLGYGDHLPLTPSARMIASLEAVIGQLYIAVLVARLVGMHIAEGAAERRREGT